MALSIETSELMEIFQWLHSDKAVKNAIKINCNYIIRIQVFKKYSGKAAKETQLEP